MARLPVQPRSEGWPPGSMVRLGGMELAGRRGGGGGVSGLGGWGLGGGRIFYVGGAWGGGGGGKGELFCGGVGGDWGGGGMLLDAETRRRGGRRGERIFGIGFGPY